MEKKIIIILFLVVLIITWVFFWIKQKNKIKPTVLTNEWITEISSTWILETDIIKEEELSEEEMRKKRVEALRKKLALRWLIIKWDINVENQEYTSALIKYLQIHKEIPEDQATIHKLWDVYFNMKKFKKAYSYYSQIKDYEKLDKDRVVKTLISFNQINKGTIDYLNNEIDTLNLSKEQSFYYKNSISCTQDFSLCKQHFQDYFAAQNAEEEKRKEEQERLKSEWKTSTWRVEEIKKFEELYNIEEALINYENFQVDDLLYKWALVSWAFYHNWLYPIAIATSQILLQDKKDYKPLLKIAAKSYYELWNFVDAKLYLIEYNKLVKDDAEASYFIWVVYEKLHEYVLSTIHLKKALSNWYSNQYDLNKRILFNYYELWDIDKMLEIFRLLVDDFIDDVTVNDLSLAIYYHIVNDDIHSAKNISAIAIKKFPESEVLNWYMGWILMEEINRVAESPTSTWSTIKNDSHSKEGIYDEAEKYIDKWLEIDSNSPMLNLVKWKLEISKWDVSKWFIYFKKTISLDNNWDFWKIAKQELEWIQVSKPSIDKNGESK